MPTPPPPTAPFTSQETPTPTSPPLLSSSYPITLKFVDVGYRVKVEKKKGGSNIKRMISSVSDGRSTAAQEKIILNGVTGIVSPGEILAVLGPSGSGKSTLLNALAGRLIQGQGLTGTILANGCKLSKPILRRTGFVTQDDVLYPHLTVRETLIFCALLRLPRAFSKAEKIAVCDSVIAELGLVKCENTIIGNAYIRGVSGGERKRVSIGHEMLMNPSLLILDEPTSGLDSTAAHRLVTTLGTVVAQQKGKTVVASVHQPSSRVFQMFDKILVLSEGQCVYFGKGSEAMNYFESLGFKPSFAMNPADFLLDLANGVCQGDSTVSERDKSNIKQTLVSSYNATLAPKVKDAILNCTDPCMKHSPQSPHHRRLHPLETTTTRSRYQARYSKFMNTISFSNWFNQFTVLLHRSLKERKHESFNPLRVFQVLAASLLAGLMWWHSDYGDVQDRLGLLFFISIFWGVFPSFNSVFAFPQDHAIFIKERASGMYTLSPYFTARIVGDLPMELLLPFIFLTVTYWMSGLRPDLWSFLLTVLVVLFYVLVSQGLGLFLGAAMMDAKQASTVAAVVMLGFVLIGGYYVHKVPSCMGWLKYVSITFYCYRLLIYIQYGNGKRISEFLGCFNNGGIVGDRGHCKFVEQDVVGQINPWVSFGALVMMFMGYRMLAYLALRKIKT
ncbi:ABC transporter G family member 25 [Prosopis cineraria]|uniref:ABC transporter G family member 25 n=1 Tax=Prosopis cineraria TaxID=364024 RepID=UPI0024106322|nr:ABC transporter G family member 25 [Prosopis cineraria]